VIVIDLKHNYKEYLQELAAMLHAELKNGLLLLPHSFGEGYVQLVELPNGLDVLVSEIIFHDDVMYKRSKSTDYYCNITFNEIELSGAITFTKDGMQMEDKGYYRAGVAVSSSLSDTSFLVKANTKAKTINFILTEEWLKENLNFFEGSQTLEELTLYKNTLTHPEPFDAQNRILFDEVFHADRSHPMYNMLIKNRIMYLLEHFLSKLYRNMKRSTEVTSKKIKPSDLSKLMEIESLLVKDFSQPPPTIVNLAARTGMSVSKLKTAFKKVYNTGIYEYYQKNRMQKARTLLLTGQYNVKEVGLQLGYTNLSNFSLAFKKEFGILPSQV
jgi:AraC-like DNA-binding protein